MRLYRAPSRLVRSSTRNGNVIFVAVSAAAIVAVAITLIILNKAKKKKENAKEAAE